MLSRRALAGLLALSLAIAAACSSSDDDDAAAEEVPEETTTTTDTTECDPSEVDVRTGVCSEIEVTAEGNEPVELSDLSSALGADRPLSDQCASGLGYYVNVPTGNPTGLLYFNQCVSEYIAWFFGQAPHVNPVSDVTSTACGFSVDATAWNYCSADGTFYIGMQRLSGYTSPEYGFGPIAAPAAYAFVYTYYLQARMGIWSDTAMMQRQAACVTGAFMVWMGINPPSDPLIVYNVFRSFTSHQPTLDQWVLDMRDGAFAAHAGDYTYCGKGHYFNQAIFA